MSLEIVPEGASESLSQNIVKFILKASEFCKEFKFAVYFSFKVIEYKSISRESFVSPMNVISSFEHNIRVVLLIGSGPRDVAQELGELRYHIGVMCVCAIISFTLFNTLIPFDKYYAS